MFSQWFISSFIFFTIISSHFVLLLQAQVLKGYSHENVKNKKLETLCFHDNAPEERGTQVALYDYADFAEQFWGVKSKIFFVNSVSTHDGLGLKKFQKRFNVTFYPKTGDYRAGGRGLLAKVLEEKCDFLYVIKAGTPDSVPTQESLSPEVVPIGYHAVFDWGPHGSSYAAISNDVTRKQSGRNIVPHMIRQVDMEAFAKVPDLRKHLNIPESALVICRHGGKDTFNLHFAHAAIDQLVHEFKFSQLHFILMNTHKSHQIRPSPQVHYIPAIIDMEEKESYYKTCNAMLHARTSGESFGLSVGEFSAHNLPVITYPGSSRFHIEVLGDKGYVYNDINRLKQIIREFINNGIPKKDYNAYDQFNPMKVMKIFKQYFLDPIYGPDCVEFKKK